MAVLSFKVQADYEKVVRLREEITKLENQLKSFGRNTPLNEIKAIENRLSKAKKEFTDLATEAAESGAVVNSSVSSMAKNIAALFTVQKAAEFATQVATVRGEFQKLEIAFETMLQSKERADALMAQIVDTAAKTPFDLQGVASGAKQLLAYGVASEQVNETLIRLGDIASGLSIPLGDLVYLYGTTMAQGRMYTMDLRQFQGRGIPMAEELAKVMGVTKKEVSELVTTGKVGFPEMEKAIKNMTNEGGKFAGLMEKQSKTITGQISNLEDSIAQMFNEIGQSTEGAISGAIGVVSKLVENYKEVGEVIAKIAIVYGTYKAAVVAYSAVNSAAIKAEKDMLIKLLAVKAEEAAIDNASVATTGRVVAANNAEIVSLRAELEAKKQALVQTMLAAKAEEAAALTKSERLAVQLSLSKLQVRQAEKELAMAIATGDAEAISAAKSNLAAAAKQRNALSSEMSAAAKAHEIAATNAETATSAVNTLQTHIETAAIDNQTRATLLLTAAKQKLVTVGKGIGAVLTNPFVVATAAVAGLAYGIYKVIDVINVEDEAHENVTKSIQKHKEALDELQSKGEQLINTISSENSTHIEKARAIEDLRKLYPNLFKDMSDDEILTMKQMEATKMLADETDRLTEAELRNQIALKQKALEEKRNAKPVTGSMEAQATMAAVYSVQADRLEAEIKELETKLKEFEGLKKKAEFNALPKEAKIISLKEQIETLKNENLELDKEISDTLAKQDEMGSLAGVNFRVNIDPETEAKLAQIEANRKKYEELQRDLTKLEQDSDKGELSAKQKQANYNRKKAKERSEQEMERLEVDLRHKVTQSAINAMDEGFAKENARLKLNLDKQEETYKRELEDYLKKLQEDEKQKWLAVDPENRKEYDFTPTITKDSEEYKKVEAQYAQLGKDAVAAFEKSVKEAEVEWIFSTRQMKVDAMSEGVEKDMAQRALDNEKELFTLEQEREAYIANAKAIHDYNEELAKKKDPEHQVQAWSDEDRAKANSEYDAIIEGHKIQHYERLYNEYMSYKDKEKELTAQYEADKAELEEAYLKTGDERFKLSIDERTKAYVKSMNSLEQQYGTADYKLIFGDPSRMTSSTIEKALGVARTKLSKMDFNADPETFMALSEAIERLEEARDNNPFEGWDNSLMGVAQRLYQIGNIEKDIAKYKEEGNTDALEASEAQLEKAKKNLKKALAATGVSMFGEALSRAASSMREVAEVSGDIHLEQQAEALEKAGGFISSVASGAVSGGWIGAIVGGATSLMDMLISSITEMDVVAAEAKKTFEDYLDEIAHKARTIDREDYETIFGTRDLERVRSATELAGKALDEYYNNLNKRGKQHWQYGDNPWIAPANLREQLVWEGTKQTAKNAYKVPTLAERFPDLFNPDGTIKLDQAKAILDTYANYSGEEWYEYLSDATEALEDYEENMKAVDDYLTSMFSNIGSELADAIMQGNDAVDVLMQSVGQAFSSISKQLIAEVIISKEFIDKYREKWRQAIGTKDITDDADVVQEMTDELIGNFEAAKQMWEEIQRVAEERGIDMSGISDTTQQSASKGYQALSEDTGGELVGRALAQYESNLRIEASMREVKDVVDIMAMGQVQIRDIAAESRALIADSFLELQQIRENTGAIIKPIKNLSDKIDNWDSKIMSL